MSSPDTLEWNIRLYWAKVFSIRFFVYFFNKCFFFILVPRTLDRELGPLKKIQPTFFDMVRLIKCKTLEYGSSKPDHLGFMSLMCILLPPHKTPWLTLNCWQEEASSGQTGDGAEPSRQHPMRGRPGGRRGPRGSWGSSRTTMRRPRERRRRRKSRQQRP